MLPTIMGEFRVVADPELRFAPSGMAVTKIRAVASKRKKDEASGEWKDEKTAWVNLAVFQKAAENVAESDLKKGDLITVIGKMSTDEWEDKDGNKRISVEIAVDSIGPALAFNPALPHRADRSGQSGQRGQQSSGGAQRSSAPPQNDPWSTGGAAQTDEPPF